MASPGLSDLDFRLGLEFERSVVARFDRLVSSSPASSQPAFILVASFGRSSIRLNEDSMSLLLQACLGGIAKDFHVKYLLGWMFSFQVSCKDVGLMVYHLKSFACKSFAVFFFLWGNGGPNWIVEFSRWKEEQVAEWTNVGKKKSKPDGPPSWNSSAHRNTSKKSFADVVKSRAKPVLYHGNFDSLSCRKEFHAPNPSSSVFKRICFPVNYHHNYFNDSDYQRLYDKRSFWIPKSPLARKAKRAPSKGEISILISKSKPQNGPSHGNLVAQHCSRCLGHDHSRKGCKSRIRCDFYFNYGHLSSSCLSKARTQGKIYRPIARSVVSSSEDRESPAESLKTLTSPPSNSNSPASPHPATVANPTSTATMANFAVDPHTHVPAGFELLPPPLRAPLR